MSLPASSSRAPLRAQLALLAPAGAILLTAAWVVLGFLSPGYRLFDMVIEPYSPVSQPISGLGLGATAPWMNTAFVLCGVLIATGLLASSRTWPRTTKPGTRHTAAVLLTASGVGISICGIFDLEAVMPHLIGFVVAVGAPAVGFVLAGLTLRNLDPWLCRWLLIAGPVTLTVLVAFMVTFDPMAAADNLGYSGLLQRGLVTLTLLTTGLLGYRASTMPWRTTHAAPPPATPGASPTR